MIEPAEVDWPQCLAESRLKVSRPLHADVLGCPKITEHGPLKIHLVIEFFVRCSASVRRVSELGGNRLKLVGGLGYGRKRLGELFSVEAGPQPDLVHRSGRGRLMPPQGRDSQVGNPLSGGFLWAQLTVPDLRRYSRGLFQQHRPKGDIGPD